MTKIDLIDRSFYPDKSSSRFQTSKFIEWDRSCSTKDGPIFITDLCLDFVKTIADETRKKIAWLIEPECISPHLYQNFKDIEQKYDYVFTHHIKYVNNRNVFYYPFGGCWIENESRNIHKKTMGVSIVASDKNWTTGHKLRHEVINGTDGHLDIYGGAYSPIHLKSQVMNPYAFSVAIENQNHRAGYFTEKIIDCFQTGCIPIYCGDSSIGQTFDENGIIYCNNKDQLIDQIKEISKNWKDIYNSKIESVRNNFQESKKYLCAEDSIYKTCKKVGIIV